MPFRKLDKLKLLKDLLEDLNEMTEEELIQWTKEYDFSIKKININEESGTMLTWKDLEEKNIAIHTPTEDLMELVVDTISKRYGSVPLNYKTWIHLNGTNGCDLWNIYGKNTCITIEEEDLFKKWKLKYPYNWYSNDKNELEEMRSHKIVKYEEVKHLFETERVVKPNQIYRHFKGKYYATLGVSKPINREEFEEILNFGIVYHTELNKDITIVFKDNKYYHNIEVSENDLVIYVPLYFSDYNIYARPKDMFLSKVDKNKHPKATQEYRMELIK